MTSVSPETRPLLSLTPVEDGARVAQMTGYRHGSRSRMTCFFRCGNACDHPEPNPTDHGHVRDEIAKAVGRRSVLRGAAAGSGALLVGGLATSGDLAAAAVAPSRAAAPTGGPLARASFTSVAENRRDAVVTADGFEHNVIIRWGDPVVAGAPAFDIDNQTPEAARQQFGYNCDYVGVVPLTSTTALMVVNHEYTDENLMYPTGAYTDAEMIATSMAYHGMSVVKIRKGKAPGNWHREKNLANAPQNRRLHTGSEFRLVGPAAGDELLQTTADPTGTVVLGTLNNCAGGTTPWGTILSGEENFNQYFDKSGELDSRYTAEYARYGLTGSGTRGWSSVDGRFDMTTDPHEPHRFGWIVELDPSTPTSTPRKHTMLGRFKHEGANVIINKDGRAVAYMGDDERGDYIYKFVSAGKFVDEDTAAAKRANMKLLTKGTLYVAELTGNDAGTPTAPYDGTGTWIPLCSDTESFVDGFTVPEVLVFTRLAADAVAPTRMDRPEDVEANPVNGKVYAALTNNSGRGTTFPADEANPITSSMTRTSPGSPLVAKGGNRNGYVLEMTPTNGNHAATTFTWDLFLVCGDPNAPETYFAGLDKSQVTAISCPDNLTFDSAGNLWISTDGAPGVIGSNDALYRVPVEGPERGRVKRFLTVPKAAECCGPLIYDGDKSLFFAPQHPGEDDAATFEAPVSTWPHTDDFPRPSVCVAFRES